MALPSQNVRPATKQILATSMASRPAGGIDAVAHRAAGEDGGADIMADGRLRGTARPAVRPQRCSACRSELGAVRWPDVSRETGPRCRPTVRWSAVPGPNVSTVRCFT